MMMNLKTGDIGDDKSVHQEETNKQNGGARAKKQDSQMKSNWRQWINDRNPKTDMKIERQECWWIDSMTEVWTEAQIWRWKWMQLKGQKSRNKRWVFSCECQCCVLKNSVKPTFTNVNSLSWNTGNHYLKNHSFTGAWLRGEQPDKVPCEWILVMVKCLWNRIECAPELWIIFCTHTYGLQCYFKNGSRHVCKHVWLATTKIWQLTMGMESHRPVSAKWWFEWPQHCTLWWCSVDTYVQNKLQRTSCDCWHNGGAFEWHENCSSANECVNPVEVRQECAHVAMATKNAQEQVLRHRREFWLILEGSRTGCWVFKHTQLFIDFNSLANTKWDKISCSALKAEWQTKDVSFSLKSQSEMQD